MKADVANALDTLTAALNTVRGTSAELRQMWAAYELVAKRVTPRAPKNPAPAARAKR